MTVQFPEFRETPWNEKLQAWILQEVGQAVENAVLQAEVTPLPPAGLAIGSPYGQPSVVTWDEVMTGVIPILWQCQQDDGPVVRAMGPAIGATFTPGVPSTVKIRAVAAKASEWSSITHTWSLPQGPGTLSLGERPSDLEGTELVIGLADFTPTGGPFEGSISWQIYYLIPETDAWILGPGGGFHVENGAGGMSFELGHNIDWSQVKVAISAGFGGTPAFPQVTYDVAVDDLGSDGFPALPTYVDNGGGDK